MVHQLAMPAASGIGIGHRTGSGFSSAAATLGLLMAAAAVAGLTVLTLRTPDGPAGPAGVAALRQRAAFAKAALDGDVERVMLVSSVSQLAPNGGSALVDARFHPSPFLPDSSVLNDTIYCDPPLDSGLRVFYSEPTWMCKNIRVGKRRLPFTDTTTRTQDELTMYRRRELSGPDFSSDMCGRLPDRGNNVFLLCELLLAQLLDDDLVSLPMTSSVHIPYGNCSLPEHGRAILVGNTESDAVWHTETKLWPGFVTDIFCSFALR